MQSLSRFKSGHYYWNGRGEAVLIVATGLAGEYPVCGVQYNGWVSQPAVYKSDGKFGLSHTSDFDLKDEITGVDTLAPKTFYLKAIYENRNFHFT